MLPTSFALATALVLPYYYPNLLLVLGNPYLRLRKNATKVRRKPGIRLTPPENRKKILENTILLWTQQNHSYRYCWI